MYGPNAQRTLLVCLLVMILSILATADNPAAPPFKVFDQAVITHTERAEIYDGIAHYKYDATVGSGEFDKIRIHRIVKEVQTGHPAPATEAVMFLTGYPNTFEMLYVSPLYSTVPPKDRSIAIFLARQGVDVWGIDYGHALVPLGTTDFSSFKDWGTSKDAAHVRVAMHFARLTRWMGGLGPAPLFLAGLCYGGGLAYDVAAEEAHRPPFLRNVKGLVIIDVGRHFPDEAIRADICSRVPGTQARIESGVYHVASGINLKRIGSLAVTDPDSPSPFYPGLTNYQGGLRSGAVGSAPLFWHFVGADFGASGAPTNLRYTEDRLWFDAIQAVPPYYPLQLALDGQIKGCLEIPTPAHNPYRHIRVPVLYLGGAGGYGLSGEYTARLTGSRDIQILNIQMLPDEDRAKDYGHVDLVYSSTAESLVWTPMLNWIKAHR